MNSRTGDFEGSETVLCGSTAIDHVINMCLGPFSDPGTLGSSLPCTPPPPSEILSLEHQP